MTIPKFAVLAAMVLLAAAPVHGDPVAEAPPPAVREFPDARVRAWQLGLLRADRLQHVGFSYTSGLMVGLTSEQPVAAAATALTLGLAKELWDAAHDRFDAVDLLADLVGAAGAYGTTHTLTR